MIGRWGLLEVTASGKLNCSLFGSFREKMTSLKCKIYVQHVTINTWLCVLFSCINNDFPERITDKQVSHNNEQNRMAQDKSKYENNNMVKSDNRDQISNYLALKLIRRQLYPDRHKEGGR